MKIHTVAGATVLIVALGACDHVTTAPVPAAPLQARADGGRVVNPRATFTYFDVTSATSGGGIHGDARAADGSPGPDAGAAVYDDGSCGVTAEIFANRDGDATMDPIGGRTTLKNCATTEPRSLVLHFGTPLAGTALPSSTAGHFTNVRRILALAEIGQVGERRFRLMLRGAGSSACEHLRYGDMDADGNGQPNTQTIDGVTLTSLPILVTRTGASEWTAVSQPDAGGRHVALCETSVNGVPAYTAAYDVPLRVRVVRK